jgi:PAS domain S-box-containing protein
MVKPGGHVPATLAALAALAADAETSPRDAIVSTTRAGVVRSWNPSAVLLYGYLAEDIVGRCAEVLCPPEERTREAETVQRVLAGGPTERFDADRVCRDGTVIRVSLTVAPVVDKEGSITGLATVSWKPGARHGVPVQVEGGVESERRDAREAQEQVEAEIETERRDALQARDVFSVRRAGERREAVEQNEVLQARLQQAQRLENLGQLAGGIAHDFNNLLGVILNYATFVSEEMDAATEADWGGRWETARGDVTQIKQSAERAARLTHQLLAFARREVVRPQVIDLDQVISGMMEMLSRTLGEHIDVTTSFAGGLWPVLADPGQLGQVLMNLAVNARDAMPDGGTLSIETSNVSVDADFIAGGSKARLGRNVRLRVSDSGCGMPADVIEHAFEPFFTTKPVGTGTGLGLATAYGIIAQAEGDIQIYSEPGAGTTFSIMLPATAGAATAVSEQVPYQRSPKGETILVVEDEAALREVAKRIFVRNGYHVIIAASGPEAIEIVRTYQGDIHLLVTDVVMPYLLGKEVSEQIRALKPNIEVLFMSGYARGVLTSQDMLDPNVALVEKPFTEAELIGTAAKVLNGHFRGFTTTQSAPA